MRRGCMDIISSVFTIEAFIITTAERSKTSAQQNQSHDDCVFWLMWYSVSGVRTTRPNNYQRILVRGYASPPWGCAAQKARTVDSANLTTPLRQRTCPFFSSIQTFLVKRNSPQLHQQPYCPDMAPCDFWLFSKSKMSLKGTRFESREDIIQNMMRQLYSCLLYTSRCV